MKHLLLFINCVLALFLSLSLWGAFSGTGKTKYEVGKKKKNVRQEEAVVLSNPENKIKLAPSAEAVSVIVQKNVFDPQRSGGAAGGRGVITYSLVGIYRVGNSQGAVILSKGNRSRNNTPVKQYYRIGDTLPNGYALSSIEGRQAVLTRGGSRMTLDMAQASENFSSGSSRRRSVNPMQQMVDLMRQSVGMQYRQQMNMMQMMRNNQNNSARSGSTNRRGRSR
ncbi:MAG: hypothetical protein E7052_05205 [Lentisphaerae bacterium]|nr:hypothetical protein [Lentisphaerota bacterium]